MRVSSIPLLATKATFAMALACTVALGFDGSLAAQSTPHHTNAAAFTSLGIRLPLLPAASQNWIPVPDWLAGTWSADNEIILESQPFSGAGEAAPSNSPFPMQLAIKRSSVIGTQRDASGQIWHLASAPYARTTETPNFTETQQIQSVQLIERSAKLVKIATTAVVTRVAKSADRDFDIFKENTTTMYQPVQDGVILVSFEISDSDLSGRQLSVSKALSVELRVKQFEPIDSDQRGDLRQQFRDYLDSHNLQNLIPGGR